ncbi:cation:proton antiporter [Kytococcus sedentarius]|uniref:cation:proton antiporter n=1 Tax=Kytococcus sedentarius TaxID=1276 RepID=UPI0038505805
MDGSHIALLLLELGAVFAGLSVVVQAARALGLSPIPLYLLAGLAFGTGGLLPLDSVEPFVEVGAEIGVVMLLLVLGLEFSADELIGSLGSHGPSGLVDLLLNAPAGFVAGLLLGLPLPACLALAGVTWISSSGIVAQLLQDLGAMANRETPSVLSVLVLEDIAMAIFLPILVVVLAGGGPLQAVGGVALALGAVLVAMFMAAKQGHRIGALLANDDDELSLLRLLGIVMLVAGLAQAMGASAAVGAFLVGLSIPSSMAHRAQQLLGPLRALFASVFFVTFGLRTDPAELVPVLGVALVLALVTVLTKFGTGWFAAGRDGVGPRGRVRAGAALTARGEFSIVIAGLAVAAGYDQVGPLAAAYVVLLAVLGPVLARWAEPVLGRMGVLRRGTVAT